MEIEIFERREKGLDGRTYYKAAITVGPATTVVVDYDLAALILNFRRAARRDYRVCLPRELQ